MFFSIDFFQTSTATATLTFQEALETAAQIYGGLNWTEFDGDFCKKFNSSDQ